MFLRIDPSIPVVWRDSDTVQLGLDPEITRLGPLDVTQARGIAELIRGTSLARLAVIVGGENAAQTLVQSCGDVFRERPRTTLPRIAVVGVAPATDTIARTWAGAAASTVVAESSTDLTGSDVDFVILVSHFVVSPMDLQPWLGRDITHCAIVFGESSVRVGPLVTPGSGPCVRCVELTRIDADPTWSAVAPQVWRKTAAGDTVSLAIHAAAESLEMYAMGGGYSVRIDGQTLGRVTAPHSIHVSCGCSAIPTIPE